MASKLRKLPPELRRGLLQYYHRKRSCAAVRILLSCAVLYVVLVWIAMHVDRFTFLTLAQRDDLVRAVHGITGLLAAIRLALLFSRRCPPRETAYAIEARLDPAVEERYSTLVDVLNRDEAELSAGQREFVEQLTADTLGLDHHRRTARLVRDRRLLPWIAVCILALGCFFLPALSESYEFGLMLKRFYLPRHAYPKPSFVKIESIPTTNVIGKGQEFVLQAKTRGAVPRVWARVLKLFGREPSIAPEIHLRPAVKSGAAAEQKRKLTRIGEGRYIFAQTDVCDGFHYRIRCGDAQTNWSEVEVVLVPQVTEIKLYITPPPYSRLARRSILFEGQNLLFLKGTQVRLVFKTNQAVAERVILSDILEKPITPLWDDEANMGAYRFVLRDPMTLRIKVKNQRGFENADPAVVSFRLLEDHPPSVLLKAEQVLRQASVTDHVALPFQVEDDYGISEIAVSYLVNPAPGQEEGAEDAKLPFRGSYRQLSDVGHFDLQAAEVYPGDRIQLRLRARDSAGQSGLSQSVLIDITSFGRGAREEVRIRTLRFLAKALDRATESTAKGDQPETAHLHVSGGIYRRILEETKANGVWLPEENSFASLFDVIEREHVLTASPWDKEDLRSIDSALSFSAALALSKTHPIEYRNEMIVGIVEEMLIPLLDYRELRNLMWRFFGLRDAVTALVESRSIDSRRLELVFSTLERSASRLLRVASRIKSLDSSRLREEIKAIGQIRNAALGKKERPDLQPRFVDGAVDEEGLPPDGALPADDQKEPEKTTPASARAHLKRLPERLTNLLSVAQRGILEALRGQQQARKALEEMYEGLLAELVATPAKDDGFQEVMLLLERDTRLMRASPYHPLWPLVRNHVLSRSLLSMAGNKKADPPTKPVLLLALPPSLQAHQRAQDELLVCSRLMALARLKHVSSIEKQFAARWLVLDLDERHAQATDGQGEALQAMSLARNPDVLSAHLSRPETVCRSKAGYLALEQQVRTVLFGLVASTSVLDEANALLAKFHATNALLRDRVKVRPALAIEKQALRCLVDRLYLELMAWPAATEAALPAEQLYLKLRELRDRPPVSLHQLEDAPGEGQLSPRDFDDVDLDARVVGRHRSTVYGRLRGFIAKFQSGDEQDLDDYQQVLAEEFEETRSYLGTCAELATAEDKADVARRYVGDSEEATLAYLSASLPRLHAVVALLQDAQSALREKRAEADAFQTLIGQAQQAVDRYLKMVSLSRDSEFKEHLTTQVQNLGASIGKLGAAQIDGSKALYEAENVARKLQDLAREVEAYSQRIGKLRFTGGAQDVSQGLSAARAFEAGRRIADEVEFHRRRVSVGIFELLDDQPQVEIHQMALPHAAFLYRVVRSDLARFRPLEVILLPKGRPNYIGYLRSVLAEAGKVKIIYYRDTIPPYLGRMGSHRFKLPKKKK